MDAQTLKAEKRKVFGRKLKKLREEGLLPGNVYGKKIKSEAVQLVLKDFEKVHKEVGETGLLMLQVEKTEKPVLIHHVQLHPVTDKPLHVDFLQVDLKEKVAAKVPVELIGESPVEKQGQGTVVLLLNEIEVEALPADLPEKFEIDKSDLVEVDQTILAKDLRIDREKVELKVKEEEIVVKVEPPQKEEVAETPLPATEEAAPLASEEEPASEASRSEEKENSGQSA